MSTSQDFANTAIENGSSFLNVFSKYDNCYDFLHREDYIGVRSVGIRQTELNIFFDIVPDVDGVVLEWNDISSISHSVRKIYLAPSDERSIKPVNNLLKKHVILSQYSPTQLKTFNHCCGSQLMYESGWEYWFALIPDPDQTQNMNQDNKDMSTLTYKMILSVRNEFRKKLQNCAASALVLNTCMKNNLNDARIITILPDDQKVILNILQECIKSTEAPVGFKTIFFSFRFGEKSTHGFDIPTKCSQAIDRVTAHFGVKLIPLTGIDAMWSRQGLQSLIGNRGSLTSAMSFFESANFQSNLDGRNMDVTGELLNVCFEPQNVQFIQLYTDSPHLRPNCRYHPVSGSIAITSAVNPVTKQSLDTDSEKYLSVVENDMTLLQCLTCRLEFVTSLPRDIRRLRPKDHMNIDHLCHLLGQHPLLTPFYLPNSFASCLQLLGLNITQYLRHLLHKFRHTGNCMATWKAYQTELATEKLLWGHPLCLRSSQWSVALGVGLGYPTQSKTDSCGFLSLEEWSACMLNEVSSPPLSVWTSSAVVQRQINKCFGFHDFLQSSPIVLGRRVIEIILKDLFDMGEIYGIRQEDFICSLQGKTTNKPKVSGSITINQLVTKLCEVSSMKFPMVYPSVLQLMENNTQFEIRDVLKCGLADLELLYFPAFRVFDSHRNHRLTWQSSFAYVSISNNDVSRTNMDHRETAISQLILQELEIQNLLYTSVFKKGKCSTRFPWVSPCIVKLKHLNFSEECLIKVLTFITCVALLQEGWYVSYQKLRKLENDLPIKQQDLKLLEIQSKFLLNGFNMFRLWRLHHSIPSRFEITKPASVPVNRNQPNPNPDATDRHDTNQDFSQFSEVCHENIKRIQSRHIPADARTLWTPLELTILHQMKSENELSLSKSSYHLYQEKCRLENLPDRTFEAFKRKSSRLLKLN